jgi:hypothetical protein
VISYRTTNRLGYHEYHSDAQQCRECPLRNQCARSRNAVKVITRHVWQDDVERVDMHRLTPEGKAIYARRKETVERSFADAKQLHGHRYARFRGMRKVRWQCLLAAACQNMKKIAQLLARFYWLENAMAAVLERIGICRYQWYSWNALFAELHGVGR